MQGMARNKNQAKRPWRPWNNHTTQSFSNMNTHESFGFPAVASVNDPWKSKTIKNNSPLELLIVNPY